MTGKPISVAMVMASPGECANPDLGTSNPISTIAERNRSRSSAVRMASGRAPMTSTPKRSNTPRSASWMVRLSAVWPPMVGSRASGRSRSMIAASTSTSRGST
jgi:hypothetical protein